MQKLFTHTFKALHEQLGHWPCPAVVEQMRSNDSAFCQALVSNGYLTLGQMRQAAERYRLGITRDGGVVFWQMDDWQVLRDGKIMFYRPDCHRDHDRHPSWASARMKQRGLLSQDFQPRHCLFGLHLKAKTPSDSPCLGEEHQPVAVVEAEKTAVIMSALYPQYIWMASGGLSVLTADLLHPLHDHRVVLFPDTDPDGKTYQTWRQVAEAAGLPVYVSDVLERHATPEQKARKIDLVDFLFEQ